MSFRNFCGVVFLAFGVTVAAHAQLGVYGMYSVTQYTGVQCLVDSPNNCSNGTSGRPFVSAGSYGSPTTGKVNPTGLTGGVYYDFKSYGPVRFGVDVRGGNNHANKSASDSNGGDNSTNGDYFLAGIQGSVHTPISWLKPYAQISAGYAHSNVTEPSCQTVGGGTLLCSAAPVTAPQARYYDNFVMYEGFVGVDIHVLPLLDLRPIEVGIGNMNRVGSGSSIDGSSSVGVRSLGGGVVFHLP